MKSDLIYTREILACPFCGRTPRVENTDFDGSGMPHRFSIGCVSLGACPTGPFTEFYPSLEEAVAAWNTRTPDHHANSIDLQRSPDPRKGSKIDLSLPPRSDTPAIGGTE